MESGLEADRPVGRPPHLSRREASVWNPCVGLGAREQWMGLGLGWQNPADGMAMSMGEGSGLSTWVDRGVIPRNGMTGGRVWRVGAGHVKKKLHFGHATREGPGDVQEMCSRKQWYMGSLLTSPVTWAGSPTLEWGSC